MRLVPPPCPLLSPLWQWSRLDVRIQTVGVVREAHKVRSHDGSSQRTPHAAAQLISVLGAIERAPLDAHYRKCRWARRQRWRAVGDDERRRAQRDLLPQCARVARGRRRRTRGRRDVYDMAPSALDGLVFAANQAQRYVEVMRGLEVHRLVYLGLQCDGMAARGDRVGRPPCVQLRHCEVGCGLNEGRLEAKRDLIVWDRPLKTVEALQHARHVVMCTVAERICRDCELVLMQRLFVLTRGSEHIAKLDVVLCALLLLVADGFSRKCRGQGRRALRGARQRRVCLVGDARREW